MESEQMFDQLFIRNEAELVDVNVKLRQVDMLAVPWDQEAEVFERDEWWNEVFRRGAFDGLEEHIGRVRVNREHKIGDTVGRLIWTDTQAEQGLIVRAKISQNDRGNDTLALAVDDAISPSIGYRIKEPDHIRHDRRTRVREVFRAFLDHLSLVESPAYEGAKVLAVREAVEGEPNPPDHARILDAAWQDPEYLRAVERLSRAGS